MQNTIKMIVDLKKEKYRFDYAQQYDDVILDLTVLENGLAKDLTGETVELLYINANNTVASVTGDSILVNGNNVKITCPRDCTRSHGIAKFQLRIISTYQVSTFPIALTIVPSVNQGQAASQNISTILEQLTAKNIECGETLESLNAWISAHGDIVALDTRLTNVETDKQNKTDNTLTTTSKTIVGAINENSASLADKARQLDLNIANENIATNTSAISSLASGSPKAVLLASQMTDNTKNYVYTGVESGYIVGDWYFWNGSAWTSGGAYQSPSIPDKSILIDKFKFVDLEDIRFSSGSTFNLTSVPSESNIIITLTGAIWIGNNKLRDGKSPVNSTLYFGNGDAIANGWTRPILNVGSCTGDYGIYTFPVTHNYLLVWNTKTNEISKKSINDIATFTQYDVLLAFCHNAEIKGGMFFKLLNWLKLKKHDTDITALQGNINTLNSTSIPSYALADIKATRNKALDAINADTISLAFITDTHATDGYYEQIKTHLRSVVQMSNYGVLDFICLGGDITTGDEISKETVKEKLCELSSILNQSENPVLVLKGNHDDNSYYSVPTPLTNYVTNQEWVNRVIRPFNNGEVHDTQNLNSAYYYKDFTEKKVRVICLNASDYPIIDDGSGNLKWCGKNFWGYGARQCTWLGSEALTNIPIGYKVLVLSHMPTRGSMNGYNVTPMNGTIIEGILKACHDGSTYTGSTTGTDYDVSVNINFTSQGVRNILAYICGHNHADFIIKPDDLSWNYISVPNSDNHVVATEDTATGATIPTPRTIGTDTEDCWDVITINITTNAINCHRYGAGSDRTAS